MNPQLYLHIGPPKTATTSLQIALQEADLEWLHFGGTFQPRGRNAGSICHRLHEFAAGKFPKDALQTRKAVEEIRAELALGHSVLISEEMFLVEQHGCPFQLKIDRLARLVAEIPTTVIVTLRDPEDGLPSLYQELYGGLPISEQLSFSKFCRGPRARCFDYGFVDDVLVGSGFANRQYLHFDSLTKDQISLEVLLGGGIPEEAELPIRKSNVGNKTGRSRNMPRASLKAIGGLAPIKNAIDRSGLRGKRLYKAAVKALDCLSLRPCGARDLQVPHDVKYRLRQKYLQRMLR